MQSQNPVTYQTLLDKLLKKNNAYIIQALTAYIEGTLKEVNAICEKEKADPEAVINIHVAFISALQDLDLMQAYRQKAFKRVEPNSYDIERSSFKNYIQKQVPALTNLQSLVIQHRGVVKESIDLAAQIREARKIINSYSNGNKQPIVTRFNTAIDLLLEQIKDKGYSEALDHVKGNLKDIFRSLQASENLYYSSLTFFANFRQSHSSLQTKINAAKDILEGVLEEKQGSLKLLPERRR